MERNEEPVGVTTVCTGNSVSRANSGRGWTYRQRGHVSRGPERELPEGGHLPVCLPLALPLLLRYSGCVFLCLSLPTSPAAPRGNNPAASCVSLEPGLQPGPSDAC